MEKLWTLNLPVKTYSLTDLRWHLACPFWSSDPPHPLFDVKPQTVLDNPTAYPQHYQRILQANSQYPLLIAQFGNRWVLLDGLHRLAKLSQQAAENIRVQQVPRAYIHQSVHLLSNPY